MSQFDVTVRCLFVLTIEADSPDEAQELAMQEMNDNPPELNFEAIDCESRS